MAKDTEYKEFAKKFPAPRVIPDNLSSELLDRLRKGWIALAVENNVQVDGEWVRNYEAEAEPTYKTERGSLPAKYIPGKWEAVLFGAVRDDLKELKGKRASIAESKKRNELRRLLHFREDL